MSVKFSDKPDFSSEKGVGLVEVVIALLIIMVAALGIANLQTSSLIAAQASSVHFTLDQLSSEMLETLRANSGDASAGSLDLSSEGSSSDLVEAWGERVSEQLHSGSATITCSSDDCEINISWIEEIDGTDRTRTFLTRTPL